MDIKGFIESSLIEWEGKIASVVFLPGCNLRCGYCHAPHLVLHPGRLESIPLKQVLDYGRRHPRWLDGIVVTGGEPTIHGEGLVELIERFRAIGLQVMVETNGTRPEWVGRLIADGLVEAMAMDLKAPLTAEDYRRVTGVEADVEAVRRSLGLILADGLPSEIRITMVPGLVGGDELERMLPDLRGAPGLALQNFQPDFCLRPALRDVAPFSAAEMDEFQRMAAPFVGRCIVRGRDRGSVAA